MGKEIIDKNLVLVNMLGCHDGIPLLDLEGLIPAERIQQLIDRVVQRGGLVKNLHGRKDMYYQVNATYYSALGELEEKLLLARAIQLFMPGKPQIWYLDLFAGKNDIAAVTSDTTHKEINRTNLTDAQMEECLAQPVVQKQLKVLKLRNTFPAFSPGATKTVTTRGDATIVLQWQNQQHIARLTANVQTAVFSIQISGGNHELTEISL